MTDDHITVTGLTMRLIRNEIIEECAKAAEAFPQLIHTSPAHVRQVSGKDIAAAIRALAITSPDRNKGA